MGNKHAVRNLVPRLGRSRSVTRLSPPNYTDPAGAFEMTALIVPSCRWARRRESKITSESSLLVHYLFSFRINANPTTASLVARTHHNSFPLALPLFPLSTFIFASPLSLYRPRQ